MIFRIKTIIVVLRGVVDAGLVVVGVVSKLLALILEIYGQKNIRNGLMIGWIRLLIFQGLKIFKLDQFINVLKPFKPLNYFLMTMLLIIQQEKQINMQMNFLLDTLQKNTNLTILHGIKDRVHSLPKLEFFQLQYYIWESLSILQQLTIGVKIHYIKIQPFQIL